MGGRERNVDVSGFFDRLAVVDGFEHSELAGALLQDPRDPVQVFGPFRARHRPPGPLEREPRGPDGPVDIGGASHGDLCYRFLGGRVHRLERATARGGGELTAHE